MKKKLTAVFSLVFLLAIVSGCAEEPPPEETGAEKALSDEGLLKAMEIDEKSENILYTYIDEKAIFQTVGKSGEVPDPCRNDVILINLNLPPEARRSSTRVVVADLDTMNATGHFSVRLEDRATFENAVKLKRKWRISPSRKPMPQPKLDKRAIAQAPPPKPPDKVVLYSASWCGYCKKVRRLLEKYNVDFAEKDIEKDQQAAMDLQVRCAYHKLQCNGVPVIDWKGRMIMGFDEGELMRLIKENAAPVPAPAVKTPPAGP